MQEPHPDFDFLPRATAGDLEALRAGQVALIEWRADADLPLEDAVHNLERLEKRMAERVQ